MEDKFKADEPVEDDSQEEPEVSGHLSKPTAAELAGADPIDEGIDGADASSPGTARPGRK